MATILCPRCKIPMVLNIESGSVPGGRKISYFYRCKNCGYRLEDSIILMKKVDNGYEMKIVEYVSP